MNLEIRSENAPLKVGDEFLKYEIRSLLGHGDHAYVYEAFDPMLERTVAIKVIPDPPNSRRDLVQRSLEQGPILRDLCHRNLVSVYDVGTISDNLVYIVMERLAGHSLRELLHQRHTLPVLEALSIGIQAAEGMAWAHSLQVIHRDLKPENIFITPTAGIKVLNTGITSFIVPSGMTTEWDCVQGTLLYMSPEHLQGFGVTTRSDIFSLGALLYECLAGLPPALMGSEAKTLDDLAWRQISQMPPLLSDVVPEVPDIVARLIQQMLAKEAVLRFETMDLVASSMRDIYAGLTAVNPAKPNEPRPHVVFPSSALGMKALVPRGEPAGAAIVAGAEQLVAKGAERTSVPRPITGSGRHRRVKLGLACVLGLGLVAAVVALMRHSAPRSSADPDREQAPSTTLQAATEPRPGPSVSEPPETAASSGVAAPAGESERENARPSVGKNQKKSAKYAPPGAASQALEARPPAPVINATTRSEAPRAKPSDEASIKWVF